MFEKWFDMLVEVRLYHIEAPVNKIAVDPDRAARCERGPCYGPHRAMNPVSMHFGMHLANDMVGSASFPSNRGFAPKIFRSLTRTSDPKHLVNVDQHQRAFQSMSLRQRAGMR